MGLDMYFHEKDTKYYRNDFAYARAYPVHEFIAKEANCTNGDVYDFEITPEFFKKLMMYMKHDLRLINSVLDENNTNYEILESFLLIPCSIQNYDMFLKYREELENLIRDLSKIDIDNTKICYSGDY